MLINFSISIYSDLFRFIYYLFRLYAKIGSTFSELMNILFRVLQGSTLGSLLLIIYVCDLFILNDQFEFGSYADDTTPYVCGEEFDEILGKLEKHMAKISEWFLHNYLKTIAKKFQLF